MKIIHDAYWWVRHRTTDRYHTVLCDALTPGCHEVEERMLHSMFGLLREFVEHELPAVHRTRQRSRRPDREVGIEHLDWEIGLRYSANETLDESLVGKPTSQSFAAKEIKDLYLWWVDERPKRREPIDESGAFAAHEKLTQSGYQWKETSDPLYQEWSRAAQLCHEIEDRQHAEDEAMMKRLVSIRRSLWT